MIVIYKIISSIALVVVATLATVCVAVGAPKIIELTQTGCQFLQAESNIDHGFKTSRSEDCEKINATADIERKKKFVTLTLKPGAYVFRVKNQNVPYPLGFWLRGDGLINRARLPSVSGGGLTMGKSQDYQINLTPGEYVYSCPLNPTPDYKLVVKG